MPSELTQFPPLAVDREDSQLRPEVAATGWTIRCFTGGRPSLVTRGDHLVVHDLFAAIEDLEEAVQYQAGTYRLYQVDQSQEENPGRVAPDGE